MLDRQSPLETCLRPGRFGAQTNTPIRLSERPVRSLWQVAGWAGFDTAAKPVLAELGFASDGNYRQTQRRDGKRCWRIAPDRLLLEGCGDLSSVQTAEIVSLDLSHARTSIRIDAPQLAAFLSQLCSIDFDDADHGAGTFVQTAIDHVAVLIDRLSEETAEILVAVTWAQSVWEAICHNATPYGYEVQSTEHETAR